MLARRIEAAWKAGLHDLRVDTGAGVFRVFRPGKPTRGGYRVLLDGTADAEDFVSLRDATEGLRRRVGDGPCLLSLERPIGRRRQDAPSFAAVLESLEWVDMNRFRWEPLVPYHPEMRGGDAFESALVAARAGRCDLLVGYLEGRGVEVRRRVSKAEVDAPWVRFAAVHRVLRPTPEVRHWADAQFVVPPSEPGWPRLHIERSPAHPRNGGVLGVVVAGQWHRVSDAVIPHNFADLNTSLMVSTAGVMAVLHKADAAWVVELQRWEEDIFHEADDSEYFVSEDGGATWAPGAPIAGMERVHAVPV